MIVDDYHTDHHPQAKHYRLFVGEFRTVCSEYQSKQTLRRAKTNTTNKLSPTGEAKRNATLLRNNFRPYSYQVLSVNDEEFMRMYVIKICSNDKNVPTAPD